VTFKIYFDYGYLSYEQVGGNGYGNIDIYIYVGAPYPVGTCTRDSWKRRSVLSNPDEEWGNSFRVTNLTALDYVFEPNETPESVNNVSFVQNYDPVTTTDTALLASALEYCARLSQELGGCAPYANLQWYNGTCVNDIIAIGGPNAMLFGAASVDTFAESCVRAASEAGDPIPPLPVSAISSVATGDGLNSEISQSVEYSFTIQAKDANGTDYTTAAVLNKFEITATGLSVTLYSSESTNGRIEVSYIAPSVLGSFAISIKYRDVDHIQGSPFRVYTVVTSAAHSIASGEGIASSVYAGTYYQVIITAKSSANITRDNENDAFAVSLNVVGDITQPTNISPGVYSFTYTSFVVGQFQLSMKLGGVNILGSPHIATATLRP